MKTYHNAICPGCNLLCDDVTFQVDGRQVRTDVKCDKAQAWVQMVSQTPAASPTPDFVSDQIRALAQSMTTAQMPSIAGIANLTTQSQQLAWRIADVCNSTIDLSIANSNQGNLYALQRLGKVTASIGEIAMRGDVVVLWFCDPATSHPRLLERLQVKKTKRIIVVDSVRTKTAQVADEFIQLPLDAASDFLADARQILKRSDSDGAAQDSDAAIFATALMHADYGCLIYGHPAHQTQDDPVTLSHQKLVRELNDVTRCVSIGLRDDANGVGAENVLASLSGYPTAVSQAAGFPQFQGNVFAASTLMESGTSDFLLLFAGTDLERDLKTLSGKARAHFDSMPKFIVHTGPAPKIESATLLQVGVCGFDDGGEYCRLDDVSLPLVALVESSLPRTQAALKELLRCIELSSVDA